MLNSMKKQYMQSQTKNMLSDTWTRKVLCEMGLFSKMTPLLDHMLHVCMFGCV